MANERSLENRLDLNTQAGEHHPESHTLLALHRGELGEAEAGVVREHLSTCRVCLMLFLEAEEMIAGEERLTGKAARGPRESSDLATGWGWTWGKVAGWVLCLGIGLVMGLLLSERDPRPLHQETALVYPSQIKTLAFYGQERGTVEAQKQGNQIWQWLFDPEEALLEGATVSVRSRVNPQAEPVTLGISLSETLGLYQVVVPQSLLPPGRYEISIWTVSGERLEQTFTLEISADGPLE